MKKTQSAWNTIVLAIACLLLGACAPKAFTIGDGVTVQSISITKTQSRFPGKCIQA